MTQTERILMRLRQGPLTASDAADELGVQRCAARILDLREAGNDIHTEMATVINRFGDECRIAIYRLIGKAEQ